MVEKQQGVWDGMPNEKGLRRGYTTGTCAALAAAGAVELLLTGAVPALLETPTPVGVTVRVPPREWGREGETAWCAVAKDGGDDIDATHGLLIGVEVRPISGGALVLRGGRGVGRVTLPGLDQPVGEAAINRVPRQMILESAGRARRALGYDGGLELTVFVPGGEAAAEKTFNPRLGIVGGISILGTSGIVEPRSVRALTETTALELRQAAALGRRVVLTPGNYGAAFWKEHPLVPGEAAVVQCSNYLGAAIDSAREAGLRELLLVGHLGKLVKVAGGIMDTHSAVADCRMELLCAHAAVCGASRETARALMEGATTDAGVDILKENGLLEGTMDSLLSAMDSRLAHRAGPSLKVGAAVFSNVHGLLGVSERAKEIITQWRTQ